MTRSDFVAECRNLKSRRMWRRTTSGEAGAPLTSARRGTPGYRISQIKRKRVEECFGWLKTIALLRKVRHRGVFKVDWVFTFACAAYNLVRMRNLSRVGSLVGVEVCPEAHGVQTQRSPKNRKSSPLAIDHDDIQKEKYRTRQFFSSLLGHRCDGGQRNSDTRRNLQGDRCEVSHAGSQAGRESPRDARHREPLHRGVSR